MGLDTGALGPRICDRSSRRHPGMGTRVSIHQTDRLSDLVRQRPLSASRGETRCDTYRNRHPRRFGAEDSRLETSARRLTRKRTPPARPRRPSASRQPHLHPGPPRGLSEHWPTRGFRRPDRPEDDLRLLRSVVLAVTPPSASRARVHIGRRTRRAHAYRRSMAEPRYGMRVGQ